MNFYKRKKPYPVIENLLSMQILYLKFLGLYKEGWKLKKFPIAIKNVFNFGYKLFMAFLIYHVALLNYITVCKKFKNESLAKFTDALSMAIIYTTASTIVTDFYVNRKEASNIVEFANKHFKKRSAKGLTYVTIEYCCKFGSLYTIYWSLIGAVMVAHFCLYPLIANDHSLPMDLWYPFDAYAYPTYYYVYATQFTSQIVMVSMFTHAGSFLLGLVILTCGQMDILFCSMKNVVYSAMIGHLKYKPLLKKLQDRLDVNYEEVNQYFRSFEALEDLDETFGVENNKNITHNNSRSVNEQDFEIEVQCIDNEILNKLIDCIQHHQLIKYYCEKLKKHFSVYVFAKSIHSSLQLANLTFVLIKTVADPTVPITRYLNIFEYLFLCFWDLATLCIAGEILYSHSNRISDAVMRIPWNLCGRKIRQTMIVILANTYKPQILVGGPLFILNFDKLKAVMKFSFSAFTLLTAISKK